MATNYVLGPNAARAVRQLIRGSGEVSRREVLPPEVALEAEFAHPYTVQWAESVSAWIIWIPTERCLVVDGVAVNITGGLTAAGGDYPTGWYKLAFLSEGGGDIYLNIHLPDSAERNVTANFAAAADVAVTGERVYALLVARIDGKAVKANITSAIALGARGGGPSPEPTTYNADVVTGLSLKVTTDSNGTHLVATLTKKRLTVLGVAAPTNEDVNVMDLEKVKLVSSSQYFTGSEQGASASDAHKFFNSTREVVVLDAANAVREENPVFEATPHSAEMDQPTGGAS